MKRETLLVELETEELPPKALHALGNAFAGAVVDGLIRAGLVDREPPTFATFATPRRLAVSVADVREKADDREVVERLMPRSVALDDAGRPTPALVKRLEKAGRSALLDAPAWTDGPNRVVVEGDGKAEAVYLCTLAPGREVATALQAIVDDALAKLPIPKRMTYQRDVDDGHGAFTPKTFEFVRPAHGLVALHGADIVPIRVLGLDADRSSPGHRFAGMRRVALRAADDYAAVLARDGRVIASFDARRAVIADGLARAAGDDRVVAPDALLDEVTALVEWPAVYRGTFDAAFLDVPPECLVLTMQQNQKYFALTDAAGALVNAFLVVSNIETDDPSAIVGGNERVLRARLADAKFFFDQDRKTPLADRVGKLETVVYHHKLGSQFDRVQRVSALAGRVAPMIGADVVDATRAAALAKADLVTDMVGEFPELQGTMGRYYALHDGEKPDVAAAIEEQYRPRFAGDALPQTAVGTALALADKIVSLTDLFGIGAFPTGDKDPFALRRAALGVVRILTEKKLAVPLDQLLSKEKGNWAELMDFVLERAKSWFVEQGLSAKAVDSTRAIQSTTRLDVVFDTVREASSFMATPEGRLLAEANKRIGNILRKSGDEHLLPLGMSPRDLPDRPDPSLFREDAERKFWAALSDVGERSVEARDAHRFADSLRMLTALASPTSAFFDEVMVNADDPAIRDNRITLLQHARAYMNQVADLGAMAA